MASPAKAANQISIALNKVLGADRFPVDVAAVAREFTKHEADPITKIQGVNLDGFEGMLSPSKMKPRWFILYDDNTPYEGRKRFTQAHEFGHYKLHRSPLAEVDYAGGTFDQVAARTFSCNPLEPHTWREAHKIQEEEADTFASYLLMPIDDYRRQVEDQQVTRSLMEHVTDRYGVTLTAAARKWIEFTEKRAAMVVARDGFALWGRASASAFRSGIFVRSGMPIPDASIVAKGPSTPEMSRDYATELPAGVWALEKTDEPVSELSFISSRLGMSITVLIFEGEKSRFGMAEDDVEDAYEGLTRFN